MVSVIVATIERWPGVQPCLDRLLPQVASLDAELILADGTRDGSGAPPPHASAYRSIRTMAEPGASVFALRAKAARAASGSFIACTEDHCIVGERWLAQILEAHRAHPDAEMVAGAVTNGSSDGLADWANFLMTFAEFMPPAPARLLKRTPPMSNVSVRRSALLGGELPEGWLELVMAPTLMYERRMHYDDSIVVSHVQPRRLTEALRSHFDNGRACAGLVLPHIAPRDWIVRLVSTPVMPWILYVSVLRSLRGRAVPASARRSLPVMGLLCMAHAVGESVGLFLGPGASARRLN